MTYRGSPGSRIPWYSSVPLLSLDLFVMWIFSTATCRSVASAIRAITSGPSWPRGHLTGCIGDQLEQLLHRSLVLIAEGMVRFPSTVKRSRPDDLLSLRIAMRLSPSVLSS